MDKRASLILKLVSVTKTDSIRFVAWGKIPHYRVWTGHFKHFPRLRRIFDAVVNVKI